MRHVFRAGVIAAFGLVLAGAAPPPPVQIITSDVGLFYRVYDSAHGHPPAEALQRDYIDAGTPGVRQFVPHRIISGEALAAEIAKNKPLYDHARSCAAELPAVRSKLRVALTKLRSLYPEAQFPPVTILIGRNNSGGTTGTSGVLIGLEVMCRPDSPDGTSADQLVHLITHEYGHVQQPDAGNAIEPTVLGQSLTEGVAELVAELASGKVSYGHLQIWTRGREKRIETQFLADADSKDLSPWLYNGIGTPEKPGDLGYWVGYRIAKSYYLHHGRSRVALRALIQMHDPHPILKESGWYPGMTLPA